jgi:hypothetical protein
VVQNGDLDFDGTPYWPEWPTGTTPGTFPSSFVESMPCSGGEAYRQYFLQTDLALSESTCTTSDPAGCTVPPDGPGGCYPFWSEVGADTGSRVLEFGNVTAGRSVRTFGGDAQYGTNELTKLGYPEFEGSRHPTCGGADSQGTEGHPLRAHGLLRLTFGRHCAVHGPLCAGYRVQPHDRGTPENG